MATQAEFQDWQRQRIANGEDPNDAQGWAEHNQRLGRDPRIVPDASGTRPPGDRATYQTPNGPRTIQQMREELRAAGGNANADDATIITTYNATAARGKSAGGGNQSLVDLINGAAQGNTDQLNFDKQKWQDQYDLAKQQMQLAKNADDRAAALLDLQRAQFQLSRLDREIQQQQFKASIALQLVQAGANLRGPEDYYQFQKLTSGGRDLLTQLSGNQRRPDFQGPTGPMSPVTTDSLLQRLGLGPILTASASVPPAPAGSFPVLPIRTGVGVPPGRRGLLGNGSGVAPLTETPPPSQMPVTQPGAAPAPEDPLVTRLRTGQMLPHQIDPGVWDSLGPVGQGLLKSAAEAAGWDWNEFQRQHYASRPRGTVDRTTDYQYSPLSGVF